MFQHARMVQAALDLWSLATKRTQELLRRRPFSLVLASKVTKDYSLFYVLSILPPRF